MPTPPGLEVEALEKRCRSLVDTLSSGKALHSLQSFVCDRGFRTLIEGILNDGQAQSKLLEAAYLHVNGFRKVVLANWDKAGGELRIHDWLPSDGVTSDKHNHPWNFASYVLAGELMNQTFVESSGATHQRSVIGPIGRGRDGYHYTEGALVGLDIATEAQLPIGSAYFMSNTLIHNAFAPAGAITVMAQGPFVKEVTLAYRPITAPRRPQGIRRLTRDELVTVLSRCVA